MRVKWRVEVQGHIWVVSEEVTEEVKERVKERRSKVSLWMKVYLYRWGEVSWVLKVYLSQGSSDCVWN